MVDLLIDLTTLQPNEMIRDWLDLVTRRVSIQLMVEVRVWKFNLVTDAIF